jgi:hypothetical protein
MEVHTADCLRALATCAQTGRLRTRMPRDALAAALFVRRVIALAELALLLAPRCHGFL